jgi:UDP-N-acetyl-D-galactosamine dehydrogenase
MKNKKITVIGLGYVGLPLALEFGKKYTTTGFDLNEKRIEELKQQIDYSKEISKEDFLNSKQIKFTSSLENVISDVYIIAVPTPIDKQKRPDLSPLISASTIVGKFLKEGDIVIYESTVYPGCTEEVCIPILEKESGLKFNNNFYCGYSPERINPGDKDRPITKIKKITSGSTPEIAELIDKLYNSIIEAGTHLAPSIKVAEAAKVIENTQRDLNIAFVNELSIIFNKIGIDTNDVLEAAGTKWNFMKFKPGLVGGHCIGVDPYYLTFKSQELGYYPEIILAGRKLNDRMGAHIANQVMKLMKKKNHNIDSAEVLMLGITFKENCTDIRNSKAIDIVNELREFGAIVDVYDPMADKHEVEKEYSIILTDTIDKKNYKAIILAVAHDEFLNIDFSSIRLNNTVVFDVKSILPIENIDGRL